MISDLHFLRPWWLMALILPPAVIWLSAQTLDIRRRWSGLIAPHLLDSLLVESDQRSNLRPAWLLAIVLGLSILGLAGPTWQREAPPFLADTAALVIAVDLSPTMDAVDISPSRIERAKLKIRDILATRQGARTGVVAYAGTAHLVVPLTDDNDLIETYTDALATRIMPKPGKDTSAALNLADSLMKAEGTPGTILLLTDGIEEGADAAANQIDSNLLVLGFGIGGAMKAAVSDSSSPDAAEAPHSSLDLDALRDMTRKMGAKVATMTDNDADVRWIALNIQANFIRQNTVNGDRWRDFGWWFMTPAVIAFALSFRRGWVVKVAALVLAMRLIAPIDVQAAGLADMWLTSDQQGRLAFERGQFERAASLFRDPNWRGVALYRAGRYQQAWKAFAMSDTADAWYNQGNCLIHTGEFDEAIAAYHKALEKRKPWPEAEANLAVAELLKKKQQEDDEEAQEPNEKPDSIQFDDKGKRGKAGVINMAEQTSEMWIRNIAVSPADLMARKFALEDRGAP
ncbi:VWA domain-containing protein [Rhizobium sp. CNPSo 4039]|uniref:vWA domain-containing protein n=1 Tax=Rhizobium sp. CNPSo 4039 TaxID=3021409 RepID=UPI00254EC0D9|nr:VWA domain-containing protein [Rhizobium sp. CNPSo 4039]MDK4717266.1 VWA domain-containing protein [Rhizobium sp. CNPSo 4039]